MVITFADISEIKAAEREIEAARAYSDSIIDTIRQPLVVLDEELRVVSANRSFYRTFAIEPDGNRRPTVRRRRRPSLSKFRDCANSSTGSGPSPSRIEDYEIEIDLPPLGRRSLLLNARKIRDGPLGGRRSCWRSTTSPSASARPRLEAAKQQAEQANLGKSRFLAAASHDLRQPLQTSACCKGCWR